MPVDDYKITDDEVNKGVDFHAMGYERRTLFLEDLMPHEEDHIITGSTRVPSNIRLLSILMHFRSEI